MEYEVDSYFGKQFGSVLPTAPYIHPTYIIQPRNFTPKFLYQRDGYYNIHHNTIQKHYSNNWE